MPRTSVVDVLHCLEDEFQDFAEAFCRGEYLLWLGSGLSRDVVPNVSALLAQMLEFLRSNIDSSVATCRFKTAFEEVLDVAAVSAETRSSLDLGSPASSWS